MTLLSHEQRATLAKLIRLEARTPDQLLADASSIERQAVRARCGHTSEIAGVDMRAYRVKWVPSKRGKKWERQVPQAELSPVDLDRLDALFCGLDYLGRAGFVEFVGLSEAGGWRSAIDDALLPMLAGDYESVPGEAHTPHRNRRYHRVVLLAGLLVRATPAGREAASAPEHGDTAAGEAASAADALSALSPREVKVLRALHERRCAVLAYDLEQACEMDRKTVGHALKSLMERGLVVRPNGTRSGNALTAKGKAVAAMILPNDEDR